MMASYYRAPVLTDEVNALDRRWPKRDRASDGWIGDSSHQARKSDHNPDWSAGGVVRAEDTDVDGIHRPTVVASLMLHSSTRYVISNRRIMHVDNHFRPKVYTGSNPHTEHIHRSIQHGKTAENNTAEPYRLIETVPSWGPKGPREGVKSTAGRELQAYLIAYGATLDLDGEPGPATIAAVKAFQKTHKLLTDGLAGPKTLAALRTA